MNINTPQKKVAVGLFFLVVMGYQIANIPLDQKISVGLSALLLIGGSFGVFLMDRHKL